MKVSTTLAGSLASIDSIEAKNGLSLLVESLARVALERELDVLRSERLAVLELDVLLEREGQRLQIRRKVPGSASSGVTEKSSLIFVRPSKML